MARTTSGMRQLVRDFGTCLSFDGGTAKTAITTVAAQNNLSTASFSCWIKMRGYGGGSLGRIFQKGTGSTVGFFDVSVQNVPDTLRLAVQWTGFALWSIPIPNNIPFGKWTHLVITYDGTSSANTPIFYINGVSVSVTTSTAASGTRASDDTNLSIGNRITDTTRGFNGLIDDIQYYNKILSQAEVTALYYQGSTTTGLVGWWKLDEGSGTSVTDSTGNASNGTITGATYSTDVFMKPRTAAGSITGKAGSFNGTSSKVAINSVAAQNSLTAMTLSMWINIQGNGGGGNGRAFQKGPNAVGYIDLSYANAASSMSFSRDGATADLSYNFTAPSLTVWHHILVTNDGTLNRTGTVVYLDGVLAPDLGTGSNGSGGLTADSANLTIGNRTSDTARAWNGYIDEVRLYNRILTSPEIATLFAKGHVQSGLVGWWSFDQLNGNITPDFSTSGTDGVTSNTTLVNGNIDYVRYGLPTARTEV